MAKLVVDDKIPYVSYFFSHCDEIRSYRADELSSETVAQADILLVRTTTRVHADLLRNTAVRFVGTATTGVDHINTEWLKSNAIAFADAAGANATAVADYVRLCVDALKQSGKLHQKNCVGIIGCGRIGSLLAHYFEQLGFTVLCYDPLRQNKSTFRFVSLSELISASDIISIHTPLTFHGDYPTYHLLNNDYIKNMKRDAILINTARGGVVDENALMKRRDILYCVDVWENEPIININTLNTAFIATPHIAGYSLEAKFNATKMLYFAAKKHFQWENNPIAMEHEVEQIPFCEYDPHAHTQTFRRAFLACQSKEDIKNIFNRERNNYSLRSSRWCW